MPSKKKEVPVKLGRKSVYSKKFVEIVKKFSLLGYTVDQLCDLLCVQKNTFYKWKKEHKEFNDAHEFGKHTADANVAMSLYNRAIGMTVKKQQAFKCKDEEPVIVELIDELPPDPKSAIHFLSVRRPDLWNAKQVVKHEGEINSEQIIRYELPTNKRGKTD